MFILWNDGLSYKPGKKWKQMNEKMCKVNPSML